jgi:hypothetical protein
MTARNCEQTFGRRRLPLSLFWLACLSLLAAGVVPGCGGCTPQEDPTAQKKKDDEDAEKKKKREEKPKEDFEITNLRVQPYDESAGLNRVKPGHWLAAHVAMKANNFHFNAELETATVDVRSLALPIEHTPFRMVVTRPAALPKGQIKHFESIYYVPRRASGDNAAALLQCRLRAAGSGREVARGLQSQGIVRMPDYQYCFVVLAAQPDRYAYLKRMDSIEQPLGENDSSDDRIAYYDVALPRTDTRVPLPSHPLAWTSIAYVLWDDLDPAKLALDQQQSLLDWLHWGGQVIISGPGSLERLRGSFLDAYLPAEHVQSRELHQTDFEPLNAYWSAPRDVEADKARPLRLNVEQDKPLLGIEMKPHAEAQKLPSTGGLVYERRVGRGRIVVTAFSLTTRNVVNWGNYDVFFNSCLLRRPPRSYEKYDEFLSVPRGYYCVDGLNPGYERDARISTLVRYFSRDIGHAGGASATGMEAFAARDTNEMDDEYAVDAAPTLNFYEERIHLPRSLPPVNPDTDDPHFGGYAAIAQSGMAGWNDYNGCAAAARQSLREAAGISIPKADFVLRVLGAYLLVLVPLNWALFKVIGRVEWAWVAAPIIAVAGAVAVVKLAQLDIGFARARTDVAVLEVQGGYPRAHLTRYTALYTSLSTAYDMTLTEESSLAQPFAVNPAGDPRLQRAVDTISFRHDAESVLSGFQVASNSTGMLHAEEMHELGGAIRLLEDNAGGWRVENGTELALRDACVLRRTRAGGVEFAWLGALEKKATAGAAFQPAAGRTRPEQWSASPVTSKPDDPDAGEVSLWQLLDLAATQLRLGPGEVRLLAWTDSPLRGVEFRPAASQLTSRTMVLAHLRHGDLPPPEADRKSKWAAQGVPLDDKQPLPEEQPAP